MFKQKFSTLLTSIVLVSTVITSNAHAGMITFAADAIVNASIDGDSNNVGSVDSFNVATDMYVRERKNKFEEFRTASFVHFDVSSLTSSVVNAIDFSAYFEADLATKINDINAMEVMMGEVNAHTWDGSLIAGSVPLFDWTNDAINVQTFANNVNIDVNAFGTYSVDVTQSVRDWVNGASANNGFVLFGSERVYQAAGFDNAGLRVNIPEPTSIAILALAVIGFTARRMKQS